VRHAARRQPDTHDAPHCRLLCVGVVLLVCRPDRRAVELQKGHSKMNGQEKFGITDWLLSDPGKAVLAGAAGGIVRWLTLREKLSDGVISIVVGALCALYLGPIVEPMLTPLIGKIAPHGDAAGFSSFFIGVGGISAAGFVLDVWRGRRRALADDGDDK